jgi:cell division septation protein DedD
MDTDTLQYDTQETEVTESIETSTGTGKVLGMFFGMVLVCAVFFAFGFTLGRNSTTSEVKAAPPEVASQPASAATVEKPSPVSTGACATPDCAPATTPQQDLTFYESVKTQQPEPTLAPAKPVVEQRPVTKARTSQPSGYAVQIAALTKAGDADAMVSVLRRKKYPVFLVDSTAVDNYYRVQVGPFSDIKDAEAMRKRLVRDGYKPILKK